MMDDEDDTKYSSNPYGLNRQKITAETVGYARNAGNSYHGENYNDDDEEEIENEEDDENDNDDGDGDGDDTDDDGGSGVQRISKDDYENSDEDSDEYGGGSRRQQKKRKLKTLLMNYEFAPRVPAPSSAGSSVPKPSYGGRNPLTDWTERETFILLDVWGDRFLKQGRKSLRSEEWQEVSERVSQDSKIERTDTQCRNRLDTLKKKYKKEKTKLEASGGTASEWVYFKKMDTLLSPLPRQIGLSCGIDSGEYIFTNPKVYLNHSNGLDEMRDSPGNSESGGGEEDDAEGCPPKKTKNGRVTGSAASLSLLANTIKKFSDVYERIEISKRQQMIELEKMWMDFHRDLELQKRQILERWQAEIARIRQGDGED